MAKFNWKSIDSKIKAVIDSKSFKSKAFASKSGEVREMAIEAADAFISEVQNQISSSGFSAGQQGAISSWSRGEPSVNNDIASITVSSNGASGTSLYSRESVDLVDVFSLGHNPSTYVYGEWHGEYIRSSLSLTYHDFVGDAINSFQGHAGNGYVVTNITRC